MTEQDRKRLWEQAKAFDIDLTGNYEDARDSYNQQLGIFIAETGWEDWMFEYTDKGLGEKDIDEVLSSIFANAHKSEVSQMEQMHYLELEGYEL